MGIEAKRFTSEKQRMDVALIQNQIFEVGRSWSSHIQQMHIKGTSITFPNTCHQCISFKASIRYLEAAITLISSNKMT